MISVAGGKIPRICATSKVNGLDNGHNRLFHTAQYRWIFGNVAFILPISWRVWLTKGLGKTPL